ncbi:MAG: site-specific integrase [Anaerolineae bacterium]|nr:site-specific integrase [Anaerolineae bacterium]
MSSFYELARKDEKLQQVITSNPTRIARPEAPAPYQNKRAQALADEEIQALLTIIRQHAIDNLHAKRDYALFLLYILTGMRRAEVIGLRWGDVKVGDVMKIRAQVKGGDFVEREVANAQAQTALLHYLSASGRLEHMRPETPLWTRHDRAGRPGPPLTARAFVENLKRYALEAGIPHIHLHQTRHTFARMVAEETGSLIETQDALGHAHLKTTRVYVKRIAVKKDKHSDRIASRLGI